MKFESQGWSLFSTNNHMPLCNSSVHILYGIPLSFLAVAWGGVHSLEISDNDLFFRNFFFQKLYTKVNNSYFFNKNSIRKLDGFPTTIGSFWVDPQIAATIHPAPETQQGKYYKAKF